LGDPRCQAAEGEDTEESSSRCTWTATEEGVQISIRPPGALGQEEERYQLAVVSSSSGSTGGLSSAQVGTLATKEDFQARRVHLAGTAASTGGGGGGGRMPDQVVAEYVPGKWAPNAQAVRELVGNTQWKRHVSEGTRQGDVAYAGVPAVMVDFFAPWCGHCMQLAPAYEQAAKALQADGWFGALMKVDGSKAKNQALMQRFGVRGFPSLLVFLDGIVVDEFTGQHSAEAIVTYMRQYLTPPPDMYNTLGVDRNCSLKRIKKAYRELSRQLHPDKNSDGGDPERFTLVTQAYETLSDADARSNYDAFGSIKFQQKGMQREYMQLKGIKLKLYSDEDSAVQSWTQQDFNNRKPGLTYVVDFYAPVR
jgi:thiol-disulfide isomerase/thioredoxin